MAKHVDGLPALPAGLFWRVSEGDVISRLGLITVQLRERRKRRWLGSRWLSERVVDVDCCDSPEEAFAAVCAEMLMEPVPRRQLRAAQKREGDA